LVNDRFRASEKMNGRNGAKNPAAGHGRLGEFANGSFGAAKFEKLGFC
jgi:hypothetical protein